MAGEGICEMGSLRAIVTILALALLSGCTDEVYIDTFTVGDLGGDGCMVWWLEDGFAVSVAVAEEQAAGYPDGDARRSPRCAVVCVDAGVVERRVVDCYAVWEDVKG